MNINIPKRIEDRLCSGIKRFQPVLLAAHKRDANESDTSMIIIDMLSEIFGFDKYSEITTEFAIRGTYCDIALRFDGSAKPVVLIEVKAIGIPPDERHTKQAIDYAANQGVEWVVLSTGIEWILYRVTFGKPIGQEEILRFNFLEIDHKNSDHVFGLYVLSKDGWAKELASKVHAEREILNRFNLGALVLSEPIIDALRRELRRLAPDVKAENDQLLAILKHEVIKREVLEGEKADAAARRINRHLNKTRKLKENVGVPSGGETATNLETTNVVVIASVVNVQPITTPPNAAS